VTICTTPPISRGGSWANDDTIYFTPDFTGGVQRVAAAGGRPANVTTLDLSAQESNHLFPKPSRAARCCCSPFGRVETSTPRAPGRSRPHREAHPAHRGRRRGALPAAGVPRVRTGWYSVRCALRPEDSRSSGRAHAGCRGGVERPATGTAHYAVSQTGTLVYAPGQDAVHRDRIAWVDRRGGIEFLPCDAGYYDELKLSPDGAPARVRLPERHLGVRLRQRTTTRTTFRGVNQARCGAPDGRHIVFSSSQNVTRPRYPGLIRRAARSRRC